MKLQGRNLSASMQGPDVALLQRELRKLGFVIPRAEFQAKTFMDATQQAVRDFQTAHRLQPTGVVNEQTATAINAAVEALQPIPTPLPQPKPQASVVRGRVRQTDGSAVVSVFVRVSDKDMRREQRIGEANTDRDGRYEITYKLAQPGSADKKSTNLIVRVFDNQNNQLAQSPVHFNAPAVTTVDLTIGSEHRPASEYEQLIASITPVSKGVQLADLTKDDVAFLVGKAGVEQEKLELLIVASRLAQKTNLASEVFYGLFRQSLPADLPSLLSNSSSDLSRALESSLKDNTIPAELESQLESILATLRQLFVQHSLQPSDKNAPRSLGELLAISGLSQEQRQIFLRLFAERDGAIKDFWNKLREHPAFQAPGALEDLKLTLQLDSLTRNNIPLIQAIKGLSQRDGVKSMRDLVKLDSGAWAHLMSTPVNGEPIPVPDGVAGATPEERLANYTSAMMDSLRTAFPTATSSHRIAAQPEIDLKLVRTVLEKNPDVDPADLSPDSIDLTGISAEEQARARASLLALKKEIKTFPGLDYKKLMRPGGEDGQNFRNPVREGVSKLLANARDLDLHTTRIDAYLERNVSTAFQGIREEDKPAVVDQLKRLQRVFRITPRDDQMSDLLAEGLDSAQSIANVPRGAFAQRFQDRWGSAAEVMKVYSQARHVSAATTALHAQVSQALAGVSTQATGSQSEQVSEAIKKIPNWQNLFGALSYCDCRHCSSVYGPSAYFVDLLQFLRESGRNQKDKTPLQVLLGRRPDLEYIKLSCQNAETALPYVDLVNEILETRVALGKLKGSSAKDTGDATADELSANPQYINDRAYDKLSGAHYPLTLPFNRSLEVVRTYLEHLGSSRYQVMKTFQRDGKPSDLAIACEFLKISPKEHGILTSTNLDGAPLQSQPGLAEFYGYTAADDWVVAIRKAPTFLRQTGVTYLELIELIQTHFINPDQSFTLVVSAEADQCDLAKTRIHDLNESALRKMHRFIRLHRKLGWKIHELDRTITALGAADIDDDFLLKLDQVKQLQTELNLPLDQLLSFWDGIDTEGRESLYVKLFQNKAILNPVDPDFRLSYTARLDVFPNVNLSEDWMKEQFSYDPVDQRLHFTGTMTDAQREALLALSADDDFGLAVNNLYEMRAATGIRMAASDLPLSDHVNTILAALRITATDLQALRTATGLDDEESQPVLLTRANLSALHRCAVLAKALRLTINDFVSFISLTGSDPFKDPDSTLRFVDNVRQVQQSAFSVSQLNYIYRDLSDPVRNVAPLQANVNLLIDNLQAALKRIAEDTTAVPDPTGDLLRQKLAIVLDSNLVDPVMRVLDGSANYSQSIANELAVLPQIAEAIEQAANNPSLNRAERFNRVLTRLMRYLRDTLSRSLIKQTLSDNLKIDSELLELLIEGRHHKHLLSARSDSSRPAIADFLGLDNPELDDPLLPPADPALDATLTYRLLHKIALLVDTFKITVSEIAYLSSHPDDFAGVDPESGAAAAPFDLNLLPLDSADFKPALFYQWRRLNDLFSLRNSLPATEVGLLHVFAAPSRQSAHKHLAAATNWDLSELLALTGNRGFNLDEADFKNEITLVKLQSCWNLMNRLGVSAKQLFDWATHNPDDTQAQDLQNIVKAKYDDETWLNIAKPLNDVLRERQKAALIVYLLADPSIRGGGITDSSGLYEYFLIDVDMSACMMTSRIVQASAAVQLFVQRCLMNLEDGKDDPAQNVAPSQIDSDAWDWMKQYRVWEANRKVFLYPENWILPELRDDKSPFFKELETELLQNDLAKDTAEQAIKHYLEKLEGVARLEICGMYWQEDKEPDPLTGEMTRILHVFGRTFNSPHAYYYRRLPLQTGVWTAWEQVTVDIEGDHLVPIVWNERLFLFWPIFEEKPNQDQDLGAPLVQTTADLEAWKKYRQDHSNWVYEYNRWKYKHELWEVMHQAWRKAMDVLAKADEPLVLPPEPMEPAAPKEPSEPSPSSQPSLTHWEIKLGWSEYQQQKWTAKQTSSETITSRSRARTLSQVLGDHGPTGMSFEARQEYVENHEYPKLSTVVQIYLPGQEEHFIKTSIESDELVFEVYRRYLNVYDLFGKGAILSQLKDYDYLGAFKTACGSKVRSVGGVENKRFDSLALPNGATNSFMTLVDDEGHSFLAFTVDGKSSLVLLSLPKPSPAYSIVNYHQLHEFRLEPPFDSFFYQDTRRTYFVEPFPPKDIVDGYFAIPRHTRLQFNTFDHPHVCSFIEALNRDGIPGLLSLTNQYLKRQVSFQDRYQPSTVVAAPYPEEVVDFASDGAYSLYNWELFFHIPLMIATRLSENQKFAEAQQWFHYIFNPTYSSDRKAPKRFWRFQPFHENTESDRIQDLLNLLDYEGDDPDMLDRRERFENEVDEWRQTPFNPHLIARLRLIAYQKTVVMKYIDNLVAWGDFLFSQDTMESVNEAMQLYVLAQDLLGPRPQFVPERGLVQVQTYHELKPYLDRFSNALVELENQFPFDKPPTSQTQTVHHDVHQNLVAQLQNHLAWSS